MNSYLGKKKVHERLQEDMKPADKKLEKLANKELYRMIKDGAVIDVGGHDDDSTFYPEAHSNKWGGECWLKISHKDKDKIPKNKKAKTKIKDGKLEVEVDVDGTGRKHRMREGSLEWDVEYASVGDLPEDDIERFQLEFPYDQLTFFHQEELTQEEVSTGANRPENVINSFAGYFNKSNRLLRAVSVVALSDEEFNIKITSGELFQDPESGIFFSEVSNYETGKFCHIYRQKMIAYDGAETWVVQDIIDNELQSVIPRQWCIDHGFPVILDPNIGYESVGGTTYTGSTAMRGNHKDAAGAYFAVSANADKLDKIYIWTGNGGHSIDIGVYDHDGSDNPDNLVDSATGTSVNDDWAETNLGQDVSLTPSAKYSMATAWNTAINVKFDTPGPSGYLFDNSITTLSDPFAESSAAGALFSIYFSYTETGGGGFNPSWAINSNILLQPGVTA